MYVHMSSPKNILTKNLLSEKMFTPDDKHVTRPDRLMIGSSNKNLSIEKYFLASRM